MKAITLKSRIIILLTIFTILTIGVFVTIQLFHELEAVNRYIETAAANYASEIENKFESITNSALLPAEKLNLLTKGLNSLKESQLIKTAYIFDKQGVIIISTQFGLLEGKGDYNDFHVLNQLAQDSFIKGETVIDKASKTLSIYIPLKNQQEVQYIARIFFSLGDIWTAMSGVYRPALIVGILLIFINIMLGIFLARLIIGPIQIFNEAAKTIAAGRLELTVDIATNDELQELAGTFNYMTKELVKMKERAENANPLTKLPGNMVIMEEIEKRIKGNQKFTVIYCDLDNFKAFNDKYGIHQGDKAIKLTAEIFKEALKEKGDTNSFLGHEGGDDFILLASPEQAETIANYIIVEFDRKVRTLYTKEDLEKGAIVAHARDGSICSFPIMTISLAGVTNVHRQINSYGEVTNIAAELKKKAKKELRSCFVLDKRSA
ncbi:MAG: diguanylate cyclase [Candidatus Omnitrophica bacterium]|nr:diguanylate cyclase [Candidatus Omnitrophota bacterium]